MSSSFFFFFNLYILKVDVLVIQLFLDHRSSCLEEEELNLFIDVDCVHTEAIMTPMPEGLSQQQVAGFWNFWSSKISVLNIENILHTL